MGGESEASALRDSSRACTALCLGYAVAPALRLDGLELAGGYELPYVVALGDLEYLRGPGGTEVSSCTTVVYPRSCPPSLPEKRSIHGVTRHPWGHRSHGVSLVIRYPSSLGRARP